MRTVKDGDGDPVAVPAAIDAVLNGKGLILLSRDDILGRDDIVYEVVDVPEWGGAVRVRSLTGTERDEYDAESYRMRTAAGNDPTAALVNFRARRVARALVDASGEPLFTAADIEALGRKNGKVIDALDDVVTRLSGMDTDAVDEARTALKAAPSGGSGSDSPSH